MRVRHEDVRAPPGSDHGGPDPDVADLTLDVPHLDGISFPDGPLEQQDEPRGEIPDERLQSEPDADTKSSHQDGDLRQIHAQSGQAQDEAGEHDRVLREIRQGERDALGETDARQDVHLQDRPDDRGQGKCHPYRHHEEQDVADRDPDRPPGEPRAQRGANQAGRGAERA